MFTGIVTALGEVRHITHIHNGMRLSINCDELDMSDVGLGDSIAVNGVCLTITSLGPNMFTVDVSQETINCTAEYTMGSAVNLEKALRLSDRLGGHLVSGHIDGVGKISALEAIGENRRLDINVPEGLVKYIARKGSITVNGVSLTVNEVNNESFSVNLIPYTLAHTSFKELATGALVNLEVDIIARYLERLMTVDARYGA